MHRKYPVSEETDKTLGEEVGVVADLAAICERENAATIVEEGEVTDSSKNQESPTAEHGYSSSGAEQPTPNGSPAQTHVDSATPASPKKKSPKPVRPANEIEKSSIVEAPAPSSETNVDETPENEVKGERKSLEEEDTKDERKIDTTVRIINYFYLQHPATSYLKPGPKMSRGALPLHACYSIILGLSLYHVKCHGEICYTQQNTSNNAQPKKKFLDFGKTG